MQQDLSPILAPQLNVNDDTVTFIKWLAAHGSSVKKDDEICEVETSKAVFKMTAERDGVLFHLASPDSVVRIGDRVGFIGVSLESIQDFLSREEADKKKALKLGQAQIDATPKARELARKHEIDLRLIAVMGVRGAIKESDVLNYLSRQEAVQGRAGEAAAGSQLLEALSKYAADEGELSKYERFIAQKLKASMQNILYATIDTKIDLTSVKELIRGHKEKEKILSLMHIVICALGRSLPKFPLLTKFQFNHRIFKYRETDVAFITKTFDNLLYSPVVRKADKLGLDQVSEECQALVLQANRHEIRPDQLEGACFTVSYIPNNIVHSFTALQDRFQSAILSISGEQDVLRLSGDKVIQVPMSTLTLSYDHTIMDGWYAADFLADLTKEIEQIALCR